jgi:hypothetical protein
MSDPYLDSSNYYTRIRTICGILVYPISHPTPWFNRQMEAKKGSSLSKELGSGLL